jgi:UDP-glucose-4-epimerase GalE
MRDTVLVTGGAGFIGSHTCKALAHAGYLPVVYDNLSSGTSDAVKWGPLEVGDLLDEARIAEVVFRHRPVAVLHFAGVSEAGSSVADPQKFYENNVGGTLALLRMMREAAIDKIVFSSTAAVYGQPKMTPISENHPLNPMNPYGRSKLMVEEILNDMGAAYGIRYCALRYFNAAGADPDGELGENHNPETHLIPCALEVAYGLRSEVLIFGTDYATPDGTCIRDYVHVSDLADGHVLALGRLEKCGDSMVANLGTGRGYSVFDVLKAVEEIVGVQISSRNVDPRLGDSSQMIAQADLARSTLGWRPRRASLHCMIRHGAGWIDQKINRECSRMNNN